jgi:hypothetical protein
MAPYNNLFRHITSILITQFSVVLIRSHEVVEEWRYTNYLRILGLNKARMRE